MIADKKYQVLESIINDLFETICLESFSTEPGSVGNIPEYQILDTYIRLMSYFPNQLAEVLAGQKRIREVTTTYKIPAGITSFHNMRYEEHRGDLLSFIELLLEFRAREGGISSYINPIAVNTFIYEYSKVKNSAKDNLNEREEIFRKLCEIFSVDDDMIIRMKAVLEEQDRTKTAQKNMVVEKEQ